MWNRKDLKSRAKVNYKKNPWMSVLASLILLTTSGALYTFVSKSANNTAELEGFDGVIDLVSEGDVKLFLVIVSAMLITIVVSIALRILVLNPLSASCSNFYVENIKEEKANTKAIFKGVEKGTLGRLVVAVFMKKLICGLWSLLFVIPGIVKNYQYRFVEYLIIQNPGMKWREAMKVSKAMTDGQKANIFVLDLSFVLWYILVSIPFLGWFVLPYILQTDAELYMALKK